MKVNKFRFTWVLCMPVLFMCRCSDSRGELDMVDASPDWQRDGTAGDADNLSSTDGSPGEFDGTGASARDSGEACLPVAHDLVGKYKALRAILFDQSNVRRTHTNEGSLNADGSAYGLSGTLSATNGSFLLRATTFKDGLQFQGFHVDGTWSVSEVAIVAAGYGDAAYSRRFSYTKEGCRLSLKQTFPRPAGSYPIDTDIEELDLIRLP